MINLLTTIFTSIAALSTAAAAALTPHRGQAPTIEIVWKRGRYTGRPIPFIQAATGWAPLALSEARRLIESGRAVSGCAS